MLTYADICGRMPGKDNKLQSLKLMPRGLMPSQLPFEARSASDKATAEVRVCVCVYMYVCMYVFMYVYKYIYYIYIHICIYICNRLIEAVTVGWWNKVYENETWRRRTRRWRQSGRQRRTALPFRWRAAS